MRVIINNQYYSTLEAQSVSTTNSASDPVPTCTLNLRDNSSSITIPRMSEVIVLDDQVYPNPAVNLFLNPSLDSTFGVWGGINVGASIVFHVGGSATATFNNANSGSQGGCQQTVSTSIVPGQTYCLSVTTSGAPATNVEFVMSVVWLDGAGNTLRTDTSTVNPLLAASTRQTFSVTAPANAFYANITFYAQATASSNNSVITFTQAQFEPQWFPTLSYPTPWVGPSQTNCQQLPFGFWIRQYRKFAGFVTKVKYASYHGNYRTLTVSCVGYAWLAASFIGTDSFSTEADSTVITTLLSKYFRNGVTPNPQLNGLQLCTTTNVISGVNVSSTQLQWDDLRTTFDSIVGLSTFYWTIDYYWNFIYCPPGYITSGIGLICDQSSQPDNVTTFPAYNFSWEDDFTQPGSNVVVIGGTSGGTTFTAEVIDPSEIANIGFQSGYFLPATTSFMRKVTDAALLSNADCTTRGIGELLQYDQSRKIYHLSTNQELIAGQSVAVTSYTDGLNNTTLLIQQVTAKWIGNNNKTLNDLWEYTADLGAANRAATNILSRIFRVTQKGTAAPAIATTTLATIERLGITDQIDANSLYAEQVLMDSPLSYQRLGEPAGFGITTAYDWSGNGANGAIAGGVTLGQPGAIYNDPNTAMLFDGSTGKISSLSGLSVTGLSALTLEAWMNFPTLVFTNPRILSNDHTSSDSKGCELICQNNGGGIVLAIGNGTTSMQIFVNFLFQANTWYHIVGTWSAAGNGLVYINAGNPKGTGTLSGTIAAPTANMAIGFAPATNANFFPGLLDEVAVYGSQLSQARIQAHYNVGVLGHT